MTDYESVIRDALIKVVSEGSHDLVNHNADAIRSALMEVEENKLTVSISVKLVLAGTKLLHTTKISFSTKFTDDCEGVENLDKDQMKLGIEEDPIFDEAGRLPGARSICVGKAKP